MANLSPFQKGFGSLQLFSVCQPVPSDSRSDFFLTGLRRDQVTKSAPGVFRELPVGEESPASNLPLPPKANRRFPQRTPELVFNVVDQGELVETRPLEPELKAVTVAPEVVHISRFASRYVLYVSSTHPTRASICLENARVAESLNCWNLTHMWGIVASMLEATGLDELPKGDCSSAENAMQFVMVETMRNLLEELAENGDVQTCVTLCEVFEVVGQDESVRIPGLSVEIIREWYLVYIDLLKDMCLFLQATFLIKNCKDPFVGALNQSSSVYEACPRCGKPLHQDGGVEANTITEQSMCGPARRACKNCRRRIGLCFLCHEPVRGMYVWCPGCGHGGHLDHALQWFGGLTGRPVREVCPTGCGHKCNLMLQLSSFPRTESFRDAYSRDSPSPYDPDLDMLNC